MKTGIVGAGAMGSLFTAFFVRAGQTPAVFEKNPSTVREMEREFFFTDQKRETVRAQISSDPSILSGCGVLFLFTKAYSTEEAMAEIAPFAGESLVVSLQNGLGNREIIGRFIEGRRVVYGTASYGAYKTAPSEVHKGGDGEVVIGGESSASVETVRSLLHESGISVRTTDDPARAVWEKAVINAGINPIGAVLSVPNGRIVLDPYASSLMEHVIREAVQVARSAGAELEADEVLAAARTTCERTGCNRCSMLQDLASGNQTEIDFITGKIISSGKQHGIPAPFNECLYLIVKAMEKKSLL